MKKLSFLFVGVFCLLLTACNINEPSVDIEAIVSPISEKEYKHVGTQELIDPKQEDFKVFNFTFNIKHTNDVRNRRIDMFEDWNNTLNSKDGIQRYWFGNFSEQDNESENFAVYQREFVFYAKGLSNEEIKKEFSDAKITVSWMNKNNEIIKKQYIIGDLIEFSAE